MEGHLNYIYVLCVCVHFPGPSDKFVIEGNDCTIVSDLSKITLQQNTDTLGEWSSWIFIIYTNLMKRSTFSPLGRWLVSVMLLLCIPFLLSVNDTAVYFSVVLIFFIHRETVAGILRVLWQFSLQQGIDQYQEGESSTNNSASMRKLPEDTADVFTDPPQMLTRGQCICSQFKESVWVCSGHRYTVAIKFIQPPWRSVAVNKRLWKQFNQASVNYYRKFINTHLSDSEIHKVDNYNFF